MAKQTSADKSNQEFIPNKKQQALLDILIDPYHRMASVTRQCELAGCCRQFYYEQMAKPDFSEYYRKLCYDVLRSKQGQMLNIGMREARKGGSQGFGYWKELMKMSGMIEDEKLNVDHTGEVTVRFVDPEVEDDTDDEL